MLLKSFLIFQHQYHTKIDDQIDKTLASMNQGVISKLMSVLEASLSKLSRYDEGSLIGSILSFTVGHFSFKRNFPLILQWIIFDFRMYLGLAKI